MKKVEEMDEVVMAEIQKSQGEYKPLAKVEELEEANYNMIDNVLNNMPPKKEPYLEYFDAECDEFHDISFNVLLIAIQSLPLLIVISRIMNLLLKSNEIPEFLHLCISRLLFQKS